MASMSADNSQTIKSYIDLFFATHKDMWSHTSAIVTLGMGAIISDSTKQIVSAQSSNESKMIAVNYMISKLLWTKRFIKAQGHKIKVNIVFQVNTSAMKLEINSKTSSGKKTRHFNINFFYFSSLVRRGKMQVKYCLTKDMIADYMTCLLF